MFLVIADNVKNAYNYAAFHYRQRIPRFLSHYRENGTD